MSEPVQESSAEPLSNEPNVLTLEGSLDISVARGLWESLKGYAEVPGHVTVSCGAVERVDAAAAQVLLAFKRRLAATGRTVRLRDLPDRVVRLLRVSGIGSELLDDESPLPIAPSPAPLRPLSTAPPSTQGERSDEPAEQGDNVVGEPLDRGWDALEAKRPEELS